MTFAEDGGKTTAPLHIVFETADQRDLVVRKYGAIEGGKQTLGRLAGYLAQPQATR